MNERRHVSVIIPSYNAAATIERCVESVLRTGYEPLEVIVVDDCSTDGTVAMAERVGRIRPGVVRIVRQPVNGGPARARNAGAREARGEYYFFLDSDTEMLPDALRRFAIAAEGADAVVGIYDAVPLNRGPVPFYKALLNYYFFSRKGVTSYEVFDASRAGVKATVFDAVGGFNETLAWGMDYENEELGYRLCQSHRVVLDPSIAVRHMFPGWRQLTRTYFFRVALWAEIFVVRRRFESAGVTSPGTGISSASLLAAMVSLAAAVIVPGSSPVLVWAAAAMFGVYVLGYAGFFRFVWERSAPFLPLAVLLNLYFTLVIAAGAGFGFLKAVFGRSDVKPSWRASPSARRAGMPSP
jgi:glycosyltransferase involved in cell wall biosynthesis